MSRAPVWALFRLAALVLLLFALTWAARAAEPTKLDCAKRNGLVDFLTAGLAYGFACGNDITGPVQRDPGSQPTPLTERALGVAAPIFSIGPGLRPSENTGYVPPKPTIDATAQPFDPKSTTGAILATTIVAAPSEPPPVTVPDRDPAMR